MALPTGGLIARFLGTTVATGAGFAFGRAAGPVLSPPLQALRNEVNERYQFVPLPPQQVAQAWVVGAPVPDGYERESARSGTSKTRWEALRASAGTAPGLNSLRTLFNRDLLTPAEFDKGLGQLGIRPEYREKMRALRWTLPTASEFAQLAAQGLIAPNDARELAEKVDANATTFDQLYQLALAPPGLSEILALRNRGTITEPEMLADLRKHGLTAERAADVASLRRYLIPPSDVIRLAVHEVYNPTKRAALNLDAEFPQAFADYAALQGISGDDARDLWAGHWQLPSYSQASEMLFRGELSQSAFDDLLGSLDYAPTWRAKLRAIARRIPTPSEYQRLVRRGVYTPSERETFGLDAEYPAAFTEKMALHGMSESDARELWAGGWRLPSAGQLYRMLWRKEITPDQLDKGLKALDYTPFWREKLANIARPTLGRIDIRRALTQGKLTPAEGVQRYMRIGLTEDDAELMVSLASTSTTTNVRELTAEQLTAEYEGGYLTAEEYQSQLGQLNFAAEELAMYRTLGDARRVAAARRQTLGTIRAAFVGHRLQEGEARAALDKTGLAADARDRVWAEWLQARDANVRVLTPAQIRKAYSNADMSQTDALAALEDLGYSAANAARFLRL